MAAKKKKGDAQKDKQRRKGEKARKGKQKSAPKKSQKKGSPRKSAKPKGPVAVKTGAGPAPAEVAARVLELLRAGNAAEVEQKWLASGIESVEGVGASMSWSGKRAVLDKYRAWEADHEINDMQVEGPWVGATGFVLKYRVDATQKSNGQRMQMEEMAVYTVRNGKIVREEFHFATGA